MASWNDVAASVPEFADAVRKLFDSHRHKFLATVRQDGSPRISGIEAEFFDGELWLGMMPGSRKALDVRRDPRLALHSASADPPDWQADAKIMGRAVEVTEPATIAAVQGASGPPANLFRVDISEVVLTRLGDPADHLVIELWREGEDLRRMERR